MCGQKSARPAKCSPQNSVPTCTPIAKTFSSEADRALAHGQFEDAERLFAAMPPSELSLIGQLRAKIGQSLTIAIDYQDNLIKITQPVQKP